MGHKYSILKQILYKFTFPYKILKNFTQKKRSKQLHLNDFQMLMTYADF